MEPGWDVEPVAAVRAEFGADLGLQVDANGCQVNAVGPKATAVAQRSSIMKLQYQTYWTDPADDDVNLAWIRRFLLPASTTSSWCCRATFRPSRCCRRSVLS